MQTKAGYVSGKDVQGRQLYALVFKGHLVDSNSIYEHQPKRGCGIPCIVGKGIRKGIAPPKPEINFYRITCQPNLDKFLRGFYFLKQRLICR